MSYFYSRVQVLIVHEGSKGSFSRVFDLEAKDLQDEDFESRRSPFEGRFPINVGITCYVAATGEVSEIVFHFSSHYSLIFFIRALQLSF